MLLGCGFNVCWYICSDRKPENFVNTFLFNHVITLFDMRTTQIGKYKVEIYDAIEDLPMQRFHKYNKMLLVDAGIGSDLADFDRHIEKAMLYAKGKTPELAAVELENMRQNVYFIQSGISPRCLAFAVLVKSIDGKEQNDLSDDALQNIVNMFSDVPIKEITANIEAVKKKIDDELQMYFPRLFEDSTIKEYFDELRRRTLLVLDSIVNGETPEKTEQIEKITMELLTYNKPKVFTGADSMEISHDKQFERMCLLLSQHLNVNPKKYTVLEFYNAFEYMQEMLKEQAKKGKRK